MLERQWRFGAPIKRANDRRVPPERNHDCGVNPYDWGVPLSQKFYHRVPLIKECVCPECTSLMLLPNLPPKLLPKPPMLPPNSPPMLSPNSPFMLLPKLGS